LKNKSFANVKDINLRDIYIELENICNSHP
jgi:hypothetical protein